MNALTSLAIKKLHSAPITVSISNGSFKRARVKVKNNKHLWEIVVSKSHSLLEQHSGFKLDSDFIKWKGHCGVHVPMPNEPQPVVTKLFEAATISDEEAEQLAYGMENIMKQYVKAFYG